MPVGSVRRWLGARSGRYRTALRLLIAAVLAFTVGSIVGYAGGSQAKLPKHTLYVYGEVELAFWAVALVLLSFAISRFNRARRAPWGYQEPTTPELAAEHLQSAGRLAETLLTGAVPEASQVWDVVLASGERALLDGMVAYSRYYGLGGAAANTKQLADRSLGGARGWSRSRSAAAAAARWRDQQRSPIVVTDRRMLCQIQAKGWLSFEHSAATAIEAVPASRSLLLEYRSTPPVRLAGAATPEITVILVWALYGANGLREHPALAEVRTLLPPAQIPDEVGIAPSSQETAEAGTRPASAAGDAAAQPSPAVAAQTAGATSFDLLTFVAVHELVLAQHVAEMFDLSEEQAVERLEELLEQNLISRVRLSAQFPAAYRISQPGAEQVDTAPPPLRHLDLTSYQVRVQHVDLTDMAALRTASAGYDPQHR